MAEYLILQDPGHPQCFPESQCFDAVITNAETIILHEFRTQKSKSIFRMFSETIQILS